MINIRVMTPEDFDPIYNLWIHTPGIGLNAVNESREDLAKYLRRNPSSSFVAEDEGKVIGSLLAGHDGRRGYLYHMAVSPAYRNQGIGRKLVESSLQALQAEGICKAALVSFFGNEAGNGFWEALGFGERNDLVYRDKPLQ